MDPVCTGPGAMALTVMPSGAQLACDAAGYQAGFGFATDIQCDDCYDGNTSTSYGHFFGQKHWSEKPRQNMRRALPPG
jgi:hypothetical protein